MKRFIVSVAYLLTFLVFPAALAKTTIPGHSSSKYDKDDNGYSDAGVKVNGHYTSL